MKISKLTAGQGNVNVEGTIKEIGEPRSFNKFGRELRVSNAVLEDDSGSIKLTLWNDEIRKFREGDVIKIINGYVNEFQGEPQLTAGRFGKMEKIRESEDSGEKQEELSDDVAETIAEDAAVEESIEEEAPTGTSDEEIEEATEELEESAEEDF